MEQTLLSTEDKRAALERSMPMWRGVVADEIINYYLTPHCAWCPGDFTPEEDLFIDRVLTHKAEFSVALQEENKAAKQKIYDLKRATKNCWRRVRRLKRNSRSLPPIS